MVFEDSAEIDKSLSTTCDSGNPTNGVEWHSQGSKLFEKIETRVIYHLIFGVVEIQDNTFPSISWLVSGGIGRRPLIRDAEDCEGGWMEGCRDDDGGAPHVANQ